MSISASIQAQNMAIFKPFGKAGTVKYGASVFGSAAEALGQLMPSAELKSSRTGDPYVVLRGESQVSEAQQKLEEAGWSVIDSKTAFLNISVRGDKATVYGDAAIALSEATGIPHAMTQSENPKPKFVMGMDKKCEYVQLLKSQHFTVKEAQRQRDPNFKSKVNFQEVGMFGSGGAHVFDRSAENLAEALGMEVGQTPGGRPHIHFPTQQDYMGVLQRLDTLALDKEKGVEVTRKDYRPDKVQISTHAKGAVIVGRAANELAATLDLQENLGFTKPSAKTGVGLPKLSLNTDELEMVATHLGQTGQEVEWNVLPSIAIARENNRDLYLYGEPAEKVAGAMGWQEHLGTTKSGTTAVLKLHKGNGTVEAALNYLKQDGYDIRVEPFQTRPSPTQRSQGQVYPDPSPVASKAVSMVASSRSTRPTQRKRSALDIER